MIAKKMLVANKPVEEIIQFTGLSKERLNQLADKVGMELLECPEGKNLV